MCSNLIFFDKVSRFDIATTELNEKDSLTFQTHCKTILVGSALAYACEGLKS